MSIDEATLPAPVPRGNEGIGCGELPTWFGVVLVATFLPRGKFLDRGLLVGDASVETLRPQDGEPGFPSRVSPCLRCGAVPCAGLFAVRVDLCGAMAEKTSVTCETCHGRTAPA